MDDCLCDTPTLNQIYDYIQAVGEENVEPDCLVLRDLYLQIEAYGNHVCVTGSDILDYSLFLMLGLVLGYILHRLGVIK